MDNRKRYGGKMRPLLALAGGYLLYLAFRQVELVFRGEAETRGQAVICVASAVLFAAVGVWVLWREWTRKADDSGTPDDSYSDDTPDDSGDDWAADDSDDSGGTDSE